MNENINICEKLKDCPKGTKLYCTIFGDVEFEEMECDCKHPIMVKICKSEVKELFTQDGRLYDKYDGECTLFPSREQRDWSKFKIKKPKFDPKTLNPFDRVIVRYDSNEEWMCRFVSHIDGMGFILLTTGGFYPMCIPYNEETKHLVGTSDEAPEFYRYWEE